MKKENLTKSGKTFTSALIAAVLAVSSVSVLPSFAAEEQIDLNQQHATGCILDSKKVMQEHLASDEQIYDLDFVKADDQATKDALVDICKTAKIATLPTKAELDNKYLPAVGNQGSQGSCSAWATVYYMKTYQEAVEHNWSLNDNKHVFSPAYTYNQVWQDPNNGGTYISDHFDMLNEQGCCPLYNMSYKQYDGTTKPNESQKDIASNYKASKNSDTDNWNSIHDIDSIKAYLAKGQPVVVSMETSNEYHALRKSDPVLYKPTISKENWQQLSELERENYYCKTGDHALCLVGYDENYNYNGKTVSVFKFVNSWGTSWGDNGYAYVTEDAFKSFNNYYIFAYVIDDKSHKDTNDFFISAPKHVKTLKKVRAYKSPDYFISSTDKDNYAYTIPKDTVVEIKKFVGCENGQQPYFITSDDYYINAQKDSLMEIDVETNIIRGDNNNSVYNYNNSETSKITVTPNCNEKFNNHNTVKIDYTVNQSDSYNGYAGAKINADNNIDVNEAKGITFKYMTPENQNGTIAICLQGSVSKKIVELPTTNGEWKTYRSSYDFNGSRISDIEVYINGNEDNCKTNPSTGTIYLAEISLVYDLMQTYLFDVSCDEGCVLEGDLSGTYRDSEELTVTANVEDEYKFLGWSYTKGGTIISTDLTYKFELNKNTKLYANVRKRNTYSFAIERNIEGGIIGGNADGSYLEGTIVSANIKTEIGYEFLGWSKTKGGEIINDSIYFSTELNENMTLYPNIKKLDTFEYKIVYDENQGSVLVSGSFTPPTKITTMNIPNGATFSLIASPKTGYHFVGWYTNESCTGTPFSTDTIIQEEATANKKLYVKFAKDDESKCVVNFISTLGGSVEGEKSRLVAKGTNIIASYIVNDGYRFKGWSLTEGGDYVSTYNPYSFTVNGDMTIYLTFERIPEYTVDLSKTEGCSKIDGTSGIDGSKKFRDDYPVTVIAHAKEGYTFEGWYDNSAFNGSPLSTAQYYTFTPNSNVTLYPKFKKDAEEYLFRISFPTINTTVTSSHGTQNIQGVISGSEKADTNITVKAIVENGYEFVGWYDNSSYSGSPLSTDSTYTFTLNKETYIYAKFDKIPEYYFNINFRTAEGMVDYSLGSMHVQGTISGSCLKGTNITVTATPRDNYQFVGWCDNSYNGSVLSTSATYTFAVNKDTNIYAKFVEKNADDSNILIKGISNSISDWTNANGGSYLNITSGSSDYLFNGAKTLKLDYNINTNDQYGGYAGRSVSLESTYKNDSSKGYNGIGFWYMTPADFNGQIALCLQSSNIGLDDLVQLPSTNGEWKYYFYQTDKTNLSDMTLYINGSKNGYTTTASNGIAKGTLYMANIEVAKK